MNVIYVDDEKPAIDNFRLTTAEFPEIRSLHTFQRGEDALAFAQQNPVDAAFLDIEMPGLHGIGLAAALKDCDPDLRVVFVTAYSQYALDAWNADATGYLLKPYTASDIRRALARCTYRPLPSREVVIRTIPNLSVTVSGRPLHISSTKACEMLALLIDHGERGFTAGEGISYLWPDKKNDPSSQSLLRMTYKRLANALEDAGAGHILASEGNRRYLKTNEVDCDLYRIMAGDRQEMRKYNGEYLREYAWAEERNAQLYWMLRGKTLEE